MCNHFINYPAWLRKPEYLALLISVMAICINVYISRKNRKHALAKEEYFKYQQIAENVISKLLIIENHREKLRIWISLSSQANTKEKTKFIDTNNTLDKSDFEKNHDKTAALIQIYFPHLWEEWNECLTIMGKILSQINILNIKIENQDKIDRKKEIDTFNNESKKLWNKPKEISDKIINILNEIKNKELN